MVRLSWVLLFAGACSAAPAVLNTQGAIEPVVQRRTTDSTRPLKGKFLHITDIHFDPFYEPGTKHARGYACHHGHGKKAGRYGAPVTRCDTPEALVNATFEWIEKNIKDEIDFVIFTGDAVRHDNDLAIPRSTKLVFDLDRYVAQKMAETFRRHRGDPSQDPRDEFVIPVIPTMGNNDITPHNIFLSGPNQWTKNFLEIWKQYIPEVQEHSFARGGWFWTEVIPNKLAVISLNTLYFFNANSASFGCTIKTGSGYEHMEWLRIQLQFMRERGMKAFMIGHVPPARMKHKHIWDESCYQKYTLWLRQYRDVIVSNFYGHMNVDHFIFHDSQDSIYKLNAEENDWSIESNEIEADGSSNETFHILGKKGYLKALREDWSSLPTPPRGVTYDTASNFADRTGRTDNRIDDFLESIGGPFGERFSMSFVSPSIVPNFFPSLRILEYNISGLEDDHPAAGSPQGHLATEKDLIHQNDYWRRNDTTMVVDEDDDDDDNFESDADAHKGKKGKKRKRKHGKGRKKKKKKKKKIRPDFPIPIPPSRTAPPGPAHSPQTFSLISWTQLFANISLFNELAEEGSESISDQGHRRDKPDGFEYRVEYSTNSPDMYNMTDLTTRHWLGLAKAMSFQEHMVSEDNAPIDGGNVFRQTLHDLQKTLGLRSDDYNTNDQPVSSFAKAHDGLRDNGLWFEFIRRAFVHARSDSDLEQEFG